MPNTEQRFQEYKNLFESKKVVFTIDLKRIIEENFGRIDEMEKDESHRLDKDLLFKDLYRIYCDVMGREFQVNLYIQRVNPNEKK
jgi:hypothetical protein